MSGLMALLVNVFIIFILSPGELVRPLPVNARFRGRWGGLIVLKNNPPLTPQNFALMNGERIGSLGKNVL